MYLWSTILGVSVKILIFYDKKYIFFYFSLSKNNFKGHNHFYKQLY